LVGGREVGQEVGERGTGHGSERRGEGLVGSVGNVYADGGGGEVLLCRLLYTTRFSPSRMRQAEDANNTKQVGCLVELGLRGT
jgi:hypothetical protein